MDARVKEVQIWLNTTYVNKNGYILVDEDGLTGNETVQALIKALQIELMEVTVDGIMGISTMQTFNNYFSGGLSSENYTKNYNIVKILTGGFYCRGIDPGDFTDIYDENVIKAVKVLQGQIGIEQTGLVNGKLMAAVLTTDSFTKLLGADESIREIQQKLNNLYENYLEKYIPTTGIVDRNTMEGLIKGVQFEIGAEVDGWWGEDTLSKLITIPSSKATKRLIYLLQYALYINGYNPNGFDGQYGNGVRNAVIQCQTDYLLEADGYCGRQTWAALLVSCGDTNRSANACDTRFEITNDIAQMLRNDGYNVVGRYIVGGSYKELRDGELETIINNGLSAFLIYQQNDRTISDFGIIQGGKAAVNANAAVIKHRIPNNSIVYFAVDMDVYEDQIDRYIIPYFRGINDNKSSTYKVGIYGPRLVCQRVINSGLAVSCFLADMSYKFSCNIGQKIPKNWSLDQFKEISNYKNLIDIDKVMFSGNGQLVNSIKEKPENMESINQKLYDKLLYIYDLAKEYEPNATVAKWNFMVLNYFRHFKYNGLAWNLLIEPMGKWVDYVNDRLPDNMTEENYTTQTYIYDRYFKTTIEITHLAATAASLMYNSNVVYTVIGEGDDAIKILSKDDTKIEFTSLQSKIVDLCGWAGDLVQLLNGLFNEYSISELTEIIGSNESDFNFEDLLQDIDAVNFFRILKNTPIKDAFYNYYENDNNNRFSKFIENRNFIGHLPSSVNNNDSAYKICKALAYQYIAKEGVDTAILVNMFDFKHYGALDSDKWKDIAPEAWAKKIDSYITG